jgi:hypothetical protein
MAKAFLGLVVAVLIVLALRNIKVPQADAAHTPCENECINDAGGKAWCADYCKEHGTYGPAKK